MENLNKRSIIDMARGAIKERADYEMTRVVENILDPNTSATAARKITITLTLKSDDTRQNIAVSCVAKSKEGNKRRSAEVIVTSIYFGDSKKDGDSAPGSYRPAGAPINVSASDFSDIEDDGELPF